MTNEPINPNEKIKRALADCYEFRAEVSALMALIEDGMDPFAERACVRALQAACIRKARASDQLAEAVRDAADLRRYEGPHRWRHDDRACDEWFTK